MSGDLSILCIQIVFRELDILFPSSTLDISYVTTGSKKYNQLVALGPFLCEARHLN